MDIDILGCDASLEEGVEIRVVYGPFWDGAWQLSVVRDPDSPTPRMKLDLLEVDRANATVTVSGSYDRATSDPDVRLLWQASSTMITGMRNLGDDIPELRSEQRPLTIHVSRSDGDQCQSGYANWPRLPGSFYFEALEMIRTGTMQPVSSREMQTAIRMHLRQVRPVWQQ
jgi:hypothetical protein